MTYREILKELKEVDLKEKFTSEFESYISKKLLSMIKNSNEIHSVGSLIRLLLKKWENETINWLFWQKVLFYFMSPKFSRIKNF